jgi:hypothetical protein
MCSEGRPEENQHWIRFFAGKVADAYLQRDPTARIHGRRLARLAPR